MEKQAVAHALQEIKAELHVHRDIATSFAGLQQPSMYEEAAGPPGSDAAVIARHNAMHRLLLQRVQGACEHQERQRQVHADMVEEAALAAAAAADGLGTDGAGSSGSAGSF
jgi:hypothetical protein